MDPAEKRRIAKLKAREKDFRLRMSAQRSLVVKFSVIVMIVIAVLLALQSSGRLIASRVLPTFSNGINSWSVSCLYRHLPFNAAINYPFDRVETARAFRCPTYAEQTTTNK